MLEIRGVLPSVFSEEGGLLWLGLGLGLGLGSGSGSGRVRSLSAVQSHIQTQPPPFPPDTLRVRVKTRVQTRVRVKTRVSRLLQMPFLRRAFWSHRIAATPVDRPFLDLQAIRVRTRIRWIVRF